jgi:hypothetical protein
MLDLGVVIECGSPYVHQPCIAYVVHCSRTFLVLGKLPCDTSCVVVAVQRDAPPVKKGGRTLTCFHIAHVFVVAAPNVENRRYLTAGLLFHLLQLRLQRRHCELFTQCVALHRHSARLPVHPFLAAAHHLSTTYLKSYFALLFGVGWSRVVGLAARRSRQTVTAPSLKAPLYRSAAPPGPRQNPGCLIQNERLTQSGGRQQLTAIVVSPHVPACWYSLQCHLFPFTFSVR